MTTKTKNKKKSKSKKLTNARDASAKVGVKSRSRPSGKPEETMDRATLKNIAGQLKGAGSGIKILKSDTDEQLQRKINEAIQQLPSAEVLKKLESIDPNKLVSVLKQDCLGIFVDFSDVSCVRCPDAVRCVAGFIDNLKTGMAGLAKALPSTVDPVEKKAQGKDPTLVAVTRYEPGRLVFVRDVDNPNPEGDDYHETFQRVLDEQPETLGELREIVEQDFDLDGDGDFMKFVTAMRDPMEGVIKLDVDLSEDNKTDLRKAGYKV